MSRKVIPLTALDSAKAPASGPSSFARGDHVELAKALVERLSERGTIVFDDGQLHRYDDARHVFSAVSESEQSQILQGFAGTPCGLKGKPLRVTRSDVSGAMKLTWDRVAIPGFFADAPVGVVFRNAFVEVTAKGCLALPHSVEHRARFAYPFSFVPDALPARLIDFLAEVFLEDGDADDKMRLLQEYMGTALLGAATRYQRVLVVYGPGANGKGVFTTVAEAAMPPGASCAIAPQDWGNEYRLAMLAGKRLNVVSELPEADILQAESFKAVVSGDSMTGRHIRQAPFTFRPVAGHIFAGNRLPGTNDQTHGFWRRILVAQFNRIFAVPEQDPKLAERLVEAELPSIVSWFLAGAARVLAQGSYTIPASSSAAVEKWKRHADQVRAFVSEWTAVLPLDAPTSEWIISADLYRAYRTWATENGHRVVAVNTFGQRMEQIGLPARHSDVGSRYPVRLEFRRFGVDE